MIHGLFQISALAGLLPGQEGQGAALPGEAVVLHQAGGRALDHLAQAVAFQQQADHGGIRHHGDALGLDALVALAAAHLLPEAGAVVGPDPFDPILHRRRSHGRGIDRQVAALGVAAHP